MGLKLKESPGEWRKSVLLTTLGLALLSSLLRWRRVLPGTAWLYILAVLATISVAALICPRWFRGYYRVSMRLGFALSQVVARVILFLFFLLVLTPLGFVLRLTGKDLLRLKKSNDVTTYWTTARESSPLDRLF